MTVSKMGNTMPTGSILMLRLEMQSKKAFQKVSDSSKDFNNNAMVLFAGCLRHSYYEEGSSPWCYSYKK